MSTPATLATIGWPAFRSALRGPAVGMAVGLGITAAVVLNPIFMPSFWVVLGRTLGVAVVLLLTYAAARAWPLRWLPAWLSPVLALAIAAPLATLAIYLMSTGGDLVAILAPSRIAGFTLIAGSGLVLGLLTALGAMLREGEAQARAQALQFELERSRLEKQALDARLSLLQAQIEPHFLFNTLANVQALVESHSPHAAEVLKSLIAYLRATVPRLQNGEPTLGDEIALVRAYLELMQMRMPDRLGFDIRLDPAWASQRFPAMALLTLVENAVRHGIDPSEQGGHIAIGAEQRDDSFVVWVADTGRGMDSNARPGTGLANLRDRLMAFYGPTARLELEEGQPQGLRATIVIPA